MVDKNKKNIIRLSIILILLFFSLVISYSLPRAQYAGTGMISEMDVPLTIKDWRGRDVTDQLNLDFTSATSRFISEAKIMQYINSKGDKLHFIILDAGNFHHPNVCFTAAGFAIRELDDTEFNISGRTIKAHTLYTEKNQETSISLYWIIIDKKITHNWIEQKIKQLYFSLFNRKRVGLMVRFDIASDKDTIDKAIATAKEFIIDLNKSLDPERVEYLFGKTDNIKT